VPVPDETLQKYNPRLMIDCGILSTVQVIVAVSFSLTTLSLEILEIVG
jgi:hypothetical protein